MCKIHVKNDMKKSLKIMYKMHGENDMQKVAKSHVQNTR